MENQIEFAGPFKFSQMLDIQGKSTAEYLPQNEINN